MAKKKPGAAGRTAAVTPSDDSNGGSLWGLALGCLVVAMLASAMLVSKHFGGHELPGCGPTSACAQLENSAWGKVPGIGWPTSFLGLAWFVGLASAWWSARRALTPLLVNLARLGAAMSVLFLGVMLMKQQLCPYCVVTHLANLGFLGLVEKIRSGSIPSPSDLPTAARRALIGMGLGFVVMTLGLAPAEINHRARKQSDAQASAARSVAAVNAAQTRPAETATPTGAESASQAAPLAGAPSGSPTGAGTGTDQALTGSSDGAPAVGGPATGTPSASESGTTAAAGTEETGNLADASTTAPGSTNKPAAAAGPKARPGFTGRYLLGPENAPYRLVMFTDLQCKDCKRVESEVMAVVGTRKDISVSLKHFPMSNQCNEKMGEMNLHPNACWAARATEAAGMVGGDAAYFKMVNWLFERSGGFTDAELRAALPQLGFDANAFLSVMQSAETDVLVKKDIAEAVDLGIQYTPMVFLNGVEFRGWEVAGVVQTALAELKPGAPSGSAENDKPAAAVAKFIEDWRVQQPRRAAIDAKPHFLSGNATAKVQVVVYGDYADENTSKLDFAVRQVVQARGDAAYSFRHYPANMNCNPKLKKVFTEYGCDAAKVVEAAGILGGDAAYNKVHEWLLSREGSLSPDFATKAATACGLDPAKLLAAMADPAVEAAISEDLRAAGVMGVIQIPQVFVNGKWLPRWMREGDDVLGKVVAEAAKL
ncbi:MAG: DsbA family protein [Candidatus Eisenbacteria bacterium]|nr:DsbA family protein [Candidatus Eisenbacteria bacterium]